MKYFKNLEEMQPYYDRKSNTYVFDENIEITFDLNVPINIKAKNIKAGNIRAWDINACNIEAWDINAYNINAVDIDACDIDAYNIKADDIIAGDIIANSVDAKDIKFYACCIVYKSLKFNSIEGKRSNSFYKCLDEEIEVKE